MPDSIKSAFVYLISSVLARGLAIITVPIFTRIMPVEEVGRVNLFTSWYTILGGVVSLGLTSGGLMMCLKKYEDEKDKYLSSLLALSSLSALIFGIIYLGIRVFFGQLIKLPDSLVFLMFTGFFICPAYDFWLAKQRYDFFIKKGYL